MEVARGDSSLVRMQRCTLRCFPVEVLVCTRDLVFTLNRVSMMWRITHAVPCCRYADSEREGLLWNCGIELCETMLQPVSTCCRDWNESLT